MPAAFANVVGMVVSIQKRQEGEKRDAKGNKISGLGKLIHQFPEAHEWERCYNTKMLMLDG